MVLPLFSTLGGLRMMLGLEVPSSELLLGSLSVGHKALLMAESVVRMTDGCGWLREAHAFGVGKSLWMSFLDLHGSPG